ncbi:MAG: DUF1501 domain-containing protein [Armatimonadetes bacterium]|nr:DUF1501 domain-containing protein [Armatimonadota bacterium]
MKPAPAGTERSGPAPVSRRDLFQQVAGGFYGAALSSLVLEDLARGRPATADPLVQDLRARPSHFPARARSVIHLFMNGGPSQMDLFDPKPELDRNHGKAYFDKIAGEVENPSAAGALMRSPFRFRQHGQCGAWVSEVLPELARHVDDLAFLRGMYTTNLTHEPALYLIQSGRMGPGYPTLGAWVTYALGTANRNLPAYVVLDDPAGLPINGVQNWHHGILSPVFQGTRFRSVGTPVLSLKPEVEQPEAALATERELVAQLDALHQRSRPLQPQLAARMESYRLAARMQLEASDALDLSQESSSTLERYGIGKGPADSYGRRCLIARRLVERGVRFVQLFIRGQIWDHHGGLLDGIRSCAAQTDQPIGALLQDLKERGLLAETLVVWGGEFGRLPIAQMAADKDEKKSGRDHNKNAMCTWMAGAGIRGGATYGETDEIGLAAVRDRVSVPDWHATILHLLGLRHEEVIVRHHGLGEKLTGQSPARVVKEILA